MSGIPDEDHLREAHEIAAFLQVAGRLKRLRRKGWVDRGVAEPESVADHSWRLALLVATAGRGIDGLNLDRALVLAVVHDLPEALAGDVTPFDDALRVAGVDRDVLFRAEPNFSHDAELRKTNAERAALLALTESLPDELRTFLRDAWEEYEAGSTLEAKIVRQLDKLETWLQALEYRQELPEIVIESFRRGTDRDVTQPGLKDLRAAIDALFPEATQDDADPAGQDDAPQGK